MPAPLPTNRTTANTAVEHVADHNEAHVQLNGLSGTYVEKAKFPIAVYVAAPTGVAATDTANIQSALNALTNGQTAQLGSGLYSISATLTKSEALDIGLVGAGEDATKLAGTAAMAGLPIIKLTNCKAPRISDLGIYGVSGSAPSAGIEFSSNAPVSQSSSEMLVERVRFGSTSANQLVDAIAFTAVTDQNNDFGVIKDCTWQNLTTCVRIGHSNSLFHRIIGGTVQGAVANFVVLAGGSFHAYGTAFASLSGWLVDFGAGTYYHGSGLTAVVTEAVPKWFRSSVSAVGAGGFGFDVVACEMNGGVDGTAPIQWAAPQSMVTVHGGELSTGVLNTKAVFSGATTTVLLSGVSIGLTGFDVAGALTIRGGVYQSGLPTMTNLGSGTVVEDGVRNARLGVESTEFGRFGAGTGVGVKRDGSAFAVYVDNALAGSIRAHGLNTGYATMGSGIGVETAGTPGDIINIGINDTRVGAVEATLQGGFFRLDVRAGTPFFQIWGRPASGALAQLLNMGSNGDFAFLGTKIGFNGSAPVGKRTLGAAATDAASTQTLANNLRQALIDLGLGQT